MRKFSLDFIACADIQARWDPEFFKFDIFPQPDVDLEMKSCSQSALVLIVVFLFCRPEKMGNLPVC